MPGKRAPPKKQQNQRRRKAAGKRKPEKLVVVTAKTRKRNANRNRRNIGSLAPASILGKFAAAITLPSECDPWRFPTPSIDTQQTALWHLTKTVPLDYSGVSLVNQTIMLTHCPLMPVWGWANNAVTRRYRWSIDTNENYSAAALASSTVTFRDYTDTNDVKCYPVRDSQGFMWSYYPGGANRKFNPVGFATDDTIVVYYRLMRTFGDEIQQSCSCNGPYTLPTSSVNQWIRIERITLTGTTFSTAGAYVEFEVPPTFTFQPIINTPALSTLLQPLEAMRVNSAGLLCMNTSANLYKNGTVQGARLSYKDCNVFEETQTSSAVGGVHEALRFSGKAAQGAYTYMIPTNCSLTFSDYTHKWADVSVAEPVSSTVICGSLEDYMMVNYIQWGVATDANDARFNLQLKYDVHLEGQTNEPVWTLGVPLLPFNEFSVVVEAAAKLVPFTENPLHTVLMALGIKVLKQITPYFTPYAHSAIDLLADRISRL